MKLIVGLGNPGQNYKQTRHNVGFFAVDKLVQMAEIAPAGENINFVFDKKFNAEIATVSIKGEKIIIIKPHTFMNLSGESISKIIQFYKADTSDLVVIHDDIDVPLGEARVRLEGSSAGHKGIQNIIEQVSTDSFARIRIGIKFIGGGDQKVENIGGPIDTKDFVLAKFEDRETKIIDNIVDIVNEFLVKCLGSKEPLKAASLKTKL